MVCSKITLHQHVENYPRTLFYFSIHDCQIYPCFSHFQRRKINENKFVICLKVKVFTCNILIEYQVVHPEGTLKYGYSTKIKTLFFLDFYSVRDFIYLFKSYVIIFDSLGFLIDSIPEILIKYLKSNKNQFKSCIHLFICQRTQGDFNGNKAFQTFLSHPCR